MSFRYSPFERLMKKCYRVFFPVPTSPYTHGAVDDICAVELIPPEALQSFFTRALAILKEKKGDDVGAYLEFGVFNGSSMSAMHQVAQDTHTTMRFFGFDAFEGLPADAEHEDDGVWQKGFYSCSFEDMQECLRRKAIDPETITWIQGWYDATLTEKTIRDHKLSHIAIAFIDCDTYSSAKSVLNFIAPLITSPTILCLDDWKLYNLDIKGMGEYKAFNEFLEENTHLSAHEMTSYNRKSRSFLVQPKV